jgi:hypothetical protein
MTTPVEKGAQAMGNSTVKNPSKASTGFDMVAAFKKVQSTLGNTSASGPVYTKQEADYAVQTIYQQMLGRNATGNDYSKAINLVMSQSQDTSTAGRQQALANAIMASPEYKIKQENKYLDGIYSAVAADVRKAQVQ